MPASKSAQKQARAGEKRRTRNRSASSQVKTSITKAEKLIVTGELEAAREAVKAAIIALDRAAEKDIIHSNNAARRKSRLLKKLNEAVALSESEPEPPEAE